MKNLFISTVALCFLAIGGLFAQSVTIVPGSAPTPGIKLSNVIANRRIVLWEDGNNDHQFYGFGINGNTLRYQVSNTNASHIFYAGANTTTSNELMRISGTGSVVIGTDASRLGMLTVIGTRKNPIIPGFASNAIFRVGASGEEGIDFGKINTSPFAGWVQSGGLGNTADPLVFNPLGGNIGIGTTIPTTTLDVRGNSAAITVGTASATGGALYLGNSAHGLQRGFPTLNADNNIGLYTTAGNLYLSASGKVTDKFILTSNGEVGIGTSDFTPGEKFAVKAGTSQFGIMPGMLDNIANDAWTTLDMTGFNKGIRIWDNLSVSDKVGIGTTTPDSPYT